MKLSADGSSDGSHQTAMDGKPPPGGANGGAAGHAYCFSPGPSGTHEHGGYFYTYPHRHQQEEASPSNASYGQYPLAPPVYGKDAVVYAHHVHPAYAPISSGWYPAPPAVPATGPYYVHPPAYHSGSPPAMYQAIDSRGSSFSSFSSSSDLETSGCKPRRQGRGRRQRRGPRHSGGNPPNRGWFLYDANTTLYQMKGRIVEIAKDREGSKFIQRRLQCTEASEIQIVFDEAVQEMHALCNDVYGNYILQGLLERGTDDMRDRIGQKLIEGDVVSLSTQVYGCRLVQKALDTLSPEDVANIVATVKGSVRHLVHDHNGNHVIQQSVIKINEFFNRSEDLGDATHELLLSSLDIIIDEITSDVKSMTMHPYGCRVCQRLIEHCNGPQKDRVLDCVVHEGTFSALINHEYGNYVLQRVLTYGRPSDRAAVFDVITGNILKLSKQKHSSNVVEMMLNYGDAEQRHQMIDEILNCHCMDNDFISTSAAVSMSEDAYGNYVIKTVLDILPEGPQRERMFSILSSNLTDLEYSQYAKQIVLRVKTHAYRCNYE